MASVTTEDASVRRCPCSAPGMNCTGTACFDPESMRGTMQYFPCHVRCSARRGWRMLAPRYRVSRRTSTYGDETSPMPIFIISPAVTFSSGIMNFTEGKRRDTSSRLKLPESGSIDMIDEKPDFTSISSVCVLKWLPLELRRITAISIVTSAGLCLPPITVRFICLSLKIKGIVFIAVPAFIIIVAFHVAFGIRRQFFPYFIKRFFKCVSRTAVEHVFPADRHASSMVLPLDRLP